MKRAPEIVFQDETLLAVSKPAGLLSVPDRYNPDIPSAFTLVCREFPNARPLHRIDLQTSGLLIFCLDPEAFGYYSDQFTDRTVEKRYLAIVEGRLLQPEGRIDLPLLTEHTGRVVVARRGKPSETLYRVEECFRRHTLVALKPLTGRTHQLRVHLSAIGHPIVGDTTYGGSPGIFLSDLKGKHHYKPSGDGEAERPLLGRTALHAESLAINRFPDGERMTLSCPLPKDMAVSLAKLRQYGRT